jgi:tetraacyldisaccharide 4'-kinase
MLKYPFFWNKLSWQSCLLYPLCLIYKLLTFLRHLFSSPIKLNIPVVCVGNITVGGTGKTQVALYLSSLFKSFGFNPIIVSKGYGGEFSSVTLVKKDFDPFIYGDEAIMMSINDNVVVYKDIKELSEWFNNNSLYDVAIFDDGLQNPHFVKDYKIITVDGHRGFGNNMILPSGPLREPKDCALLNCDLIFVVSSTKEIQVTFAEELSNKIVYGLICPEIVDCNFTKAKKPNDVVAFCGIGNPDKFYLSLKSLDLNIKETCSFPDHYKYTECDLEHLRVIAKDNKSILITTMKDYIKINQHSIKESALILKVEIRVDVNIKPKILKLSLNKEDKIKKIIDILDLLRVNHEYTT